MLLLLLRAIDIATGFAKAGEISGWSKRPVGRFYWQLS